MVTEGKSAKTSSPSGWLALALILALVGFFVVASISYFFSGQVQWVTAGGTALGMFVGMVFVWSLYISRKNSSRATTIVAVTFGTLPVLSNSVGYLLGSLFH